MNNPENYIRAETCLNCPYLKTYTDNNKLYRVCSDGIDIDLDHGCGRHPGIDSTQKYGIIRCCINCKYAIETCAIIVRNYKKFDYECFATAKNADDGSNIEAFFVCDMHKYKGNKYD